MRILSFYGVYNGKSPVHPSFVLVILKKYDLFILLNCKIESVGNERSGKSLQPPANTFSGLGLCSICRAFMASAINYRVESPGDDLRRLNTRMISGNESKGCDANTEGFVVTLASRRVPCHKRAADGA